MEQKVLILGSRGQLGRTLRDEISHCFLVRGIFCPSRKQLDITDKEALLAYVKRFQIDTIINCAAYTNVKGAETDYEGAYAVNVKAIENLCATNCKIIHISTDYVFDGEKGDFYTEEDVVYVTNKVTSTDGEVKAIAMNTSPYPEIVSCYIIIYRARHDDLTGYPHILLSQFTHMELSRLYLPKQISTNCDAISRQTCDLLNQ